MDNQQAEAVNLRLFVTGFRSRRVLIGVVSALQGKTDGAPLIFTADSPECPISGVFVPSGGIWFVNEHAPVPLLWFSTTARTLIGGGAGERK